MNFIGDFQYLTTKKEAKLIFALNHFQFCFIQ